MDFLHTSIVLFSLSPTGLKLQMPLLHIYCLGHRVHSTFLQNVMEKHEWTFWPTQIFFYSLFSCSKLTTVSFFSLWKWDSPFLGTEYSKEDIDFGQKHMSYKQGFIDFFPLKFNFFSRQNTKGPYFQFLRFFFFLDLYSKSSKSIFPT